MFSHAADPFAAKGPSAEAVNALAPEKRKAAFGYFMRSLRKNVKSGVLFTMCQDLESSFEGDRFVLETASDVIFRRLNSEENHASVAAALEAIGIKDFEIRLKAAKKDPLQQDIETIRKNFPDADIEIR